MVVILAVGRMSAANGRRAVSSGMQSPLDGEMGEGRMSDPMEMFSGFVRCEQVSSDRPLSRCGKHVCLAHTYLAIMEEEEEEGLDLSPGL